MVEEKRKLVQRIFSVAILCAIVVAICLLGLIGETLYGTVGGIILIAWFDFWILATAIAYAAILIQNYYKEYKARCKEIEEQIEAEKALKEFNKQLDELQAPKKKRGRPKKKVVGEEDVNNG